MTRAAFPSIRDLISPATVYPFTLAPLPRAGGRCALTASERKIVAALEEAIIQRVGEPRYKLWFERHTRFTWEDDTLTVGVPNRHFEEWLQKTFAGAVKDAACEVFGQPIAIRFTIDPELFQAARQEQQQAKEKAAARPAYQTNSATSPKPARKKQTADNLPPRPAKKKETPPSKKDAQEQGQLFEPGRGKAKSGRRWRRLEEFVIGPCNRVAHASAQSILEMPGEAGNPLVIHGSVGTGKTHLLEGIYVGLRRRYPDWKVLFVTAEDFTNRFVQAMHLARLGAFRKHFRECDALLMDDIHFLATKKATKEEFLHTLDALTSEGKQVVVTCDVHPRLSEDFPPELIDRLLGGAVWGLAPPDSETRLDLLRARSCRLGDILVPEEVLQFLASQLRGNVRELEGALNSLRHFSRVTGRSIDVALAREALGDLLRHAVRIVQLADVDTGVCKVLRLPAGALQTKQRAWAVSHPRMLAMYLARKHTSSAYSEIGAFFGGRNHSTAVAAEKKVRQWLEGNGELTIGERTFRVREVIELVEREILR